MSNLAGGAFDKGAGASEGSPKSEPLMRWHGKVLVVDDEPDLRTLLEFNLRQAGYETSSASTGAEALARARSLRPLVTVLDLNLPDVSGTDVCRLLKTDPATRGLGILMLTARGSEADRVLGLELGADDYVAKPFNVRELVLRVEAVARRMTAPGEPAQKSSRLLKAGPLEMDVDSHVVRIEGAEVALTLQEFRLLEYLVRSNGRVCTRDHLLTDVWHTSADQETRTVDTHVKRLRDKLARAGDLVETVRGVGFRIRQAND